MPANPKHLKPSRAQAQRAARRLESRHGGSGMSFAATTFMGRNIVTARSVDPGRRNVAILPRAQCGVAIYRQPK